MIDIIGLSFGYKEQMVLNDISFEAKPGEITAIIGANGIGKSTLLKNVCGLLEGDGTIKICGKPLREYRPSELSSQVSYLSQDTVSHALLTVFEIVLLGRIERLSQRISDEDIQAVDAVLHRLGIESFAFRYIGELSGGQRQLVFIAQALIRNPQVLVMDEPTSNLDLNYQFQIMELIKKLTVTEGLTTLITLHQLELAARFAEKIIVLDGGRVYGSGTPSEVLTRAMLREVYRMDVEIVNSAGAIHIVPICRHVS
ncbi:vitamin B12 ABC transporter [Desulfocucumis palustris]|uniref:Vitamin B12 ABC transporter n=1 Tax=Desulfocucumis palustris TaxID=1898651 RepID=A0A2L2XFX4_9FIRM|nr:ABC transporter ATP-binding protein [Desulfocucumis palustris]GBF33126.1 vitamin B12 ABC transporter [Desulfocucumis palustris]